MQHKNWWMGAALTLALTGCGTMGGGTSDIGGVAVEDRGSSADTGSGGIEVMGATDYGSLGMEALQDPSSLLSQRVVYFELDSATVLDADRELLSAHAAFLAGHAEMVVTLEGHADERGSREYNIGLGDRRAKAVRRLLEFQGVSPDQIRLVSYGEERPAAEGHDESAWGLNRRVEIVYSGQ